MAGSVGRACDSWCWGFKCEAHFGCGDYLKIKSQKKNYCEEGLTSAILLFIFCRSYDFFALHFFHYYLLLCLVDFLAMIYFYFFFIYFGVYSTDIFSGTLGITYNILNFFFLTFIYFWDRERQNMNGGGAERETHTQNLKQAPGSEPSAQSTTRGSNSWTSRSWPEPKSDA